MREVFLSIESIHRHPLPENIFLINYFNSSSLKMRPKNTIRAKIDQSHAPLWTVLEIDQYLSSNFNYIFLNSSSLLVLSIIISWMSTTFSGAMEQIFFLALSSSSSLSSLTELRFKMTLALKKNLKLSVFSKFSTKLERWLSVDQ